MLTDVKYVAQQRISWMMVVKVSTIIGENGMGKSESIDDWLLEEDLDSALSDAHQGFYLHILDEVVDGDE